MRFLRTSRLGLVAFGSLVALLLLVVAAVVALRMTAATYLDKVERLPDPFISIPPAIRPSPAEGGMTFLLIGVDAESADGAGRGDTLMVARITKDRGHAYVISIPRDSWVDVPGHGTKKINAAYSLGGPALAVQTVEKLTKLRIDHVAVVGWDGFRTMTNALGGVVITIPEDSFDPSQGIMFKAGTHRLSGEEALLYVRQRYGLPRGDLDRTLRQQNFLRALITQVVDRQILADPARLAALLDAFTGAIKVDSGLTTDDLWWLAMDAPKLREGVRFLNAPVEKLDRISDADGVEQSVVYLNEIANATLWRAVGTDRIDQYLAQYGGDVLGHTTR